MPTPQLIRVFVVSGCLMATTAALLVQAPAQAQTSPQAIGYRVCTSYFESNQSGLQGPNSFLAFAKKTDFDKVFGAAGFMGKTSFLPADAFKSKGVVAVIKRGPSIWHYLVEKIEVHNGEMTVRYKATPDKGSSGAVFSSPLILAVNQSFAGTVVFIENGKRVGKAQLAGAITTSKMTSTLAERGHGFTLAHNEKEALPLLLQAVKLNPKDGAAYLDLGIVYSRMGEDAFSLKAFQDSVHVQPTYNGYRNLGVVLLGMKRDAEGEAALKQAGSGQEVLDFVNSVVW